VPTKERRREVLVSPFQRDVLKSCDPFPREKKRGVRKNSPYICLQTTGKNWFKQPKGIEKRVTSPHYNKVGGYVLLTETAKGGSKGEMLFRGKRGVPLREIGEACGILKELKKEAIFIQGKEEEENMLSIFGEKGYYPTLSKGENPA